MLLRDVIVKDVCKYFDEVDISRILCVCKTLNALVKLHVRVIKDVYKSKYAEFKGLREINFTDEARIHTLPPDVNTLNINDIPYDYRLFPKTLTSLTIRRVYSNTISDGLLEYLAPTITKLNITGYSKSTKYNNNIAKLTNLLDLSMTFIYNIGDLPPNITRLYINNNSGKY